MTILQLLFYLCYCSCWLGLERAETPFWLPQTSEMRTYSVGILVQVSPGSRSEPGNLPTGQGRWRPQQTLYRHRQSMGSQERTLNLARCRGHQMESREQRLGLQLSLVKWEGPTCNSERRNNHTNITVIVFWLCRSFRTASSGLGRPLSQQKH